MSDSCCLIQPFESDSEFSLPKQRSKVVAHKPPRIQYCGGPLEMLTQPTVLPSWQLPSANGYFKELHLVCEVLRIRGHIDHAHHIQLASQEILVTNGLPQAILHQNIRKITSQIRETVHQQQEKSMENDVRSLWGMGERI